ncbi:MAG TPA: hypothetical protein EYQ74_06045 [Planctomycetes bacterium]|nr:hypothetical protein [Planctomycetota bacterium]
MMSRQETVSEPEATQCCRKINWVSYCLSIGAGLGIVFGGAFANPGLGLTLGVGIGVAVGSALNSRVCA